MKDSTPVTIAFLRNVLKVGFLVSSNYIEPKTSGACYSIVL